MTDRLPCPRCVQTIVVSEEDPDASLADLWEHLGIHERAIPGLTRTEMFVWSQQNVCRDGAA